MYILLFFSQILFNIFLHSFTFFQGLKYQFQRIYWYLKFMDISCKTREKAKNIKFSYEGQNGNFVRMGHAKTCHFSRSQMTKRISSLKSSRKI